MSDSSGDVPAGTGHLKESLYHSASLGRRRPFLGFWRAFISGNYFYVISAALFMLGCYMLMSSSLLSGNKFEQTVKSFLILQGYEVAVILTAVVVVRWFGRLGDAFTLFCIELALLLDPTFFSNAFLTMGPIYGMWHQSLYVCAGSLALAALKLLLLQRMLRLQFSPGAFGVFLLAAAFTWLGEAPFNAPGWYPRRQPYYYALSWAPLVIAMLIPLREGLTVRAQAGSDFISSTQSRVLPRLFLILPLLMVLTHYIETGQVYTIYFYWVYVAPIVLMVGVLVLRYGLMRGLKQELIVFDALAALAIMMSVGVSVETPKSIWLGYHPPPEFIKASIPVIACASMILVTYVITYGKTRQARILRRIVLLSIIASIVVITKTGFFTWLAGLFRSLGPTAVDGISLISSSIYDNPLPVTIAVWVILVLIAVRFPRMATWVVVIAWSVIFTPIATHTYLRYIWEILQAGLVGMLVLYNRFGDPRHERYSFAVTLAVIGTIRAVNAPATVTITAVVMEVIGLMVAGILLSDRGYRSISIGQLLVCAVPPFHRLVKMASPALLLLISGGVLFAVGLVVTFQKRRILEWMDQRRQE